MKKWLMSALLLGLSASALSAERTVVLKVPEMNCQLCAYLVNRELREIDGVQSTKASIADGTVKVVEDGRVTDAALIAAIEKLKYHVEVLKN